MRLPQRVVYRWLISLLAWPTWRIVIPIASMVDAFTKELLSNAGGHLVLTTGGKSELPPGYSTLSGDTAGGFGLIKDVPETLVWELSRWRNAEAARGAPLRRSRRTRSPSRRARNWRPGRWTPTRCHRTRCWTRCSRRTWDGQADRGRHDPALVERVVRMVDAAEYKRR